MHEESDLLEVVCQQLKAARSSGRGQCLTRLKIDLNLNLPRNSSSPPGLALSHFSIITTGSTIIKVKFMNILHLNFT